MAKVYVDKEKCIGCGLCASLVPEVFEIKEGKSEVKVEEIEEEKKDNVKKAIEACPVGAISLTED